MYDERPGVEIRIDNCSDNFLSISGFGKPWPLVGQRFIKKKHYCTQTWETWPNIYSWLANTHKIVSFNFDLLCALIQYTTECVHVYVCVLSTLCLFLYIIDDFRFNIIREQIDAVIHSDTHHQKGSLNMRTQKCFAVKPKVNGKAVCCLRHWQWCNTTTIIMIKCCILIELEIVVVCTD